MVSYLFVLQFNAIVVFLLVWPRVRPKCIKKQIRQQVGLKIMVPLTYHNKFEGFFFIKGAIQKPRGQEGGCVVSQMSMVVHGGWVGGQPNIHVDKKARQKFTFLRRSF